ncbi:hypothetical protein ACEPAG_3866 [Sanghuangporus baumii]
MNSVSTASARVSALPSPPMERKSPPSRGSPKDARDRSLDSPKEEAHRSPEDRRMKQSPSPVSSSAPSPKRPQDEQIPSADDYEKGLVLCGTCGEGVPFRDPQSGGFTLRLWDMHRDQCRSRHKPQPDPIVFTPETTVDSMANPPLKKRRAKRTEEERIEYLRTDPYVAQFEPYRVLCGSCNKWIRLRPNSTYCSIPWDAHRKSCLSKKASLPVDHRSMEMNGVASGRTLPPVSAIAGSNSQTSSLNGHGSNGNMVHPPANRHHSSLAPTPPMLSTKSRAPAPYLGSLPAPAPFARNGPGSPYATPTSMASGPYTSGPDCSPPTVLRDIGPGFGGLSSHDARRKNAEQRAAALRADPYLREVEPNRVFCGLCGKWVQLRQDSSFCAYPWHQHRAKCFARYQRRQEKAHHYPHAARPGVYDVADYRSYAPQEAGHPNGELDVEGSYDEELDSEDERHLPRHYSPDVDSEEEDTRYYSHVQQSTHSQSRRYERPSIHSYPRAPVSAPSHSYSSLHPNTGGRYKLSPQAASLVNRHKVSSSSYALRRAPSTEDMDDVSMEEDANGDDDDVDMDDEGYRPERRVRHEYDHVRRTSREYSHSRSQPIVRPPPLADLRTASGRLSFISASVQHLFKTTYDRSDELSIGALVNYLNAAMPADKHDDFDVQEVTRAAASLAKTGVLLQEGDRLRPHD